MRVTSPAPFFLQRLHKFLSKNEEMIWPVAGVVILSAIAIYFGIIYPIMTTKRDDRICTSAYGAKWDHQKRQTGAHGETIDPARVVCVNIVTGEEKPVP